MIAVDEEAVTAGVVDDVVVGNEQAVEVLRAVAKDCLTTARDVRAVHHVLVNGDVVTTTIHEHRRLRVAAEAVVLNLKIAEVASQLRLNDAERRAAGERETVNHRGGGSRVKQERGAACYCGRNRRFSCDPPARINAELRSLENDWLADRYILTVSTVGNDYCAA